MRKFKIEMEATELEQLWRDQFEAYWSEADLRGEYVELDGLTTYAYADEKIQYAWWGFLEAKCQNKAEIEELEGLLVSAFPTRLVS